MPIYEYECASCHHRFDLIQKINAEPVKQCPKCFDNSVSKLVSAAGFQLKGTGWYATDFKNKGNAPKNKNEDKNQNENKSSSTGESTASSAGSETSTATSSHSKSSSKGEDKS